MTRIASSPDTTEPTQQALCRQDDGGGGTQEVDVVVHHENATRRPDRGQRLSRSALTDIGTSRQSPAR